MSKTQLASEPSMEEILSSIRKMISDDRPGPSPMPDQLSRMHFGEQNRGPANTAPASASQPGGGQGSSFNSLADALKVATALSDQRRSLQQEIASVLDKGPRRADPLSEGPAPVAKRQALPDTAPATDSNGPRLPNFPDWRSEAAAGQPDSKRELLSFDFGTVVPQREDQSAKAGADAKPAGTQPIIETSKAEAEKPASKAEQPAEEPRVLSLRPASGLSGTAAANVAPFPRPARETTKPAAEAAPAPTAEKAPEKTTNIETPVGAAEQHASAAKTEAASARTEALLDAVVDMVQQDPSKLSVFTSGASFISGVVDKAKGSNKPAVADKLADKPDASSIPGAPPKMDRAAAELLRPMLRQWLAENMPRIVEDALRSELTDTQGDGKGPGKA